MCLLTHSLTHSLLLTRVLTYSRTHSVPTYSRTLTHSHAYSLIYIFVIKIASLLCIFIPDFASCKSIKKTCSPAELPLMVSLLCA